GVTSFDPGLVNLGYAYITPDKSIKAWGTFDLELPVKAHVIVERQRQNTNHGNIHRTVFQVGVVESLLHDNANHGSSEIDPNAPRNYFGLSGKGDKNKSNVVDLVKKWMEEGYVHCSEELKRKFDDAEKNDDMADVICQGVAWIEWQKNAKALVQEWNLLKIDRDGDSVSSFTEDEWKMFYRLVDSELE
ncbi:hypothetical protein HK102_004636, partial [Quaeritorhiza haematococci]